MAAGAEEEMEKALRDEMAQLRNCRVDKEFLERIKNVNRGMSLQVKDGSEDDGYAELDIRDDEAPSVIKLLRDRADLRAAEIRENIKKIANGVPRVPSPEYITITVTSNEFTTVLAALRYAQYCRYASDKDLFGNWVQEKKYLDGSGDTLLNVTELDELCERINTKG